MEDEMPLEVQNLMRLEGQIKRRLVAFDTLFPGIMERNLKNKEREFLRAFAAIGTREYVDLHEEEGGNPIDINELAEQISPYLDVVDLATLMAFEYGLVIGFFEGTQKRLSDLSEVLKETPEEIHHAG